MKDLLSQDFTLAICSTVISGDIVALLARHNIKVVSLIHELPHLIQQYSAEGKAKNIAEFAYKVVFPSQYVYEKFRTITELDPQKCHILPQGLFNHNPYKNNIAKARNELRKKLNLPLDSKIILGVGFADYRKGIDLFSLISYSVRKTHKDIHFIWVGRTDVQFLNTLPPKYKAHFTLVDPTPDIGLYNAGADLYLLTSREDTDPNAENSMSARDMGMLSKAMITKYPEMLEDTKQRFRNFPDNHPKPIRMENWNWMLPGAAFAYEGTDGLKTGSSDTAGYGFTITAKRGDVRLISVIIKTKSMDERFTESRELIEYGFNNFEKLGVIVHTNQVLILRFYNTSLIT
ncbi:hypothetical protein ACT4UM_02515, partial [Bacillus sp. SS-TM]